MKRLTQLAAGLALASSALVVSTSASAEVSYNIGYASEYYFRGVLQKNSSASAGIDYESEGFYAGSWAADVGDGLEVDGYFGYGIETESGLTASIGYTGYFYTGEFDDTYQEVNFGLGYGMFSLGYSVGEWEGFGASEDYDFLDLTITGESGLYGTVGIWGDEFDGEYLEVGYGFSFADFDMGIAGIINSEELSDEVGSSGRPTTGEAIVFSIGKSW